MRLYNRVVLMHRKQIWQPWVAQVIYHNFILLNRIYLFIFNRVVRHLIMQWNIFHM